MNILLIEPYFTGSHAMWAEGYKKYSNHNVEILSLKGQFWKWRMHGGAVTLAKMFLALSFTPDLIIVSDMIDLTIFQALTRKATHHIPFAVYFHENQLAYPWSVTDGDVEKKRDMHYSFINYSSALAADMVCFNSQFHMDIFFVELKSFLKGFPDYNEPESVDIIKAKSSVLALGLDLACFDAFKSSEKNGKPLILWNHRWEYDKNPGAFFRALYKLEEKGLDFEAAIVGENFNRKPDEFFKARERLGEKIIQFGYVADFAEYAKWLWRADIIPVTSNQDFFSVSFAQAVYCDCYPLLPDRLAFPEHIPVEHRGEFIYRDDDDLDAKLEGSVKDIDNIRKRGASVFVEKYKWEHMAPVYDKFFENML